jgi:hypothetical protein
MGFQVSPGVEVKEIDLTNVIPAVSTSIGGYAGYFRWGPVDTIGLISSEKELAGAFGTPDAAHTESFLTAASFLKYGNALKVVRAGDGGSAAGGVMANSVAGTFTEFDGSIDGVTIDPSNPPTEFDDLSADPGLLTYVDSRTLGTGGGALSANYDVSATNLAISVSSPPSAGIIDTLSATTFAGSTDPLRPQGTYSGVASTVTASDGVSASNGSGATFDVVVDATTGNVSSITIDAAGTLYSVGDIITIDDSVLGDAGAPNVTFTVATLTSATRSFTSGSGATDDFTDGQVLDVHTIDGDNTSVFFQIQVNPTSISDSTAVFTFSAGLGTGNFLSTFPSSLTTTTVETAGDVAVTGLSVTFKMKIAELEITAIGSGYVAEIAETQLQFISAGTSANPTTLVGDPITSGYSYTQIDDNVAAAQYIANEQKFEDIYPPAPTTLKGMMFSRYPGALGNSLGVYVIDTATWDAMTTTVETAAAAGNIAPEAGILAQFDGAPVPDPNTASEAGKTYVHILILDNDGGLTGTAGSELEKYSFLELTEGAKLADGTNNYYKDVVNAQSTNIYIARNTPGSQTLYTFSGGADSTAYAAGNINTALDVLADTETVDVNLLFAQNEPGTGANTVSNKLMQIAFDRKDAISFISPPLVDTVGNTGVGQPIAKIKAALSGLPRGIEGSYGVFDSTALYVYNKYADNYVYIPAAGHMAGLCAKTDGIAEPWFSPAGYNRGSLLGVTKLAFNPKKADRDELYKAGINPIVSFPGQGILLFGDKTGQAKPSAFDRINVRRLFMVLEKAIATAAKYQLFELNDEFTRAMFRNMTEPFLRDVKGRRGITDFLVVCDETNNTGEVIDTNRFVADIYIKPARSINFITLNFIATRTGVDFSEIVGK